MNSASDLEQALANLSVDELDAVREYIEYLKWKRAASAPTPHTEQWSYDFVENFAQADQTAARDASGMELRIAPATCGGTTRTALWEHPPVRGSAVITYAVPIPPDQHRLALRFATGIRDGAELPNDRFVAFRVLVNGWKLWSAVKNSHAWEEFRVELPAINSDVMRVQFETDGLGDHRWNWAVWGEPKLVSEL
jgi:hypothetical protein